MNGYKTFLGLPVLGVNCLCMAAGIGIVCLGIRVVKASDLALEVADTKLVTSNSAKKLERLAVQLEQQAELIEQKDKAYRELKFIYERRLKGKRGYEKLQGKFEAIDELPEVKDIEEITNEIEATEETLTEVTQYRLP